MHRRTPHRRAAASRLPPPSSRSRLSPAAAAAMSAGLFGSAVNSSITTSAFDSHRACSSPGASYAPTRATAAPRSARAVAPASDRVMPVTACPLRTSSATSGRPIAPLAPATNTFMAASPGTGLLLHRDDEVLRVPRVQDPRQHPGPDLARVPGHPVQAPARLVERLARLEHPGRLVVDGPLVLALQHVPERRPGMAVRGARLAGFERHHDRRRARLLAVQL